MSCFTIFNLFKLCDNICTNSLVGWCVWIISLHTIFYFPNLLLGEYGTTLPKFRDGCMNNWLFGCELVEQLLCSNWLFCYLQFRHSSLYLITCFMTATICSIIHVMKFWMLIFKKMLSYMDLSPWLKYHFMCRFILLMK